MSRTRITSTGTLIALAAAGVIGYFAHTTSSADEPAAPTPSSTAPATPPAAAGGAARQLAALPSATPATMTGYSRTRFGHGWDTPHGGSACDTREIVLQQQGRGVVSDPTTCRVTAGTWISLYDGKVVRNAHQLDVDHLVPEAEAWRTGAASWTPEQRKRFANDYSSGELVAVTAHSNRSKGDQPPPGYEPAQSERCRYATGWIGVKHRYRLSITRAERDALSAMLRTCGHRR